jgi:hypothetical protein
MDTRKVHIYTIILKLNNILVCDEWIIYLFILSFFKLK